MKEIVRRIYFGLVWAGFADSEVEATTGTLKHRFLTWLYGNGAPLFATQWPDHKEGCECDECVNRGFWS